MNTEKKTKKKTPFDNVVNPLDAYADTDTSKLKGNELLLYTNDKAAQDAIDQTRVRYDATKDSIESAYLESARDASIARDVATKYLPEQMARVGWNTNLGATTSAINEVSANYGESMNTARNTRNTSQTALDLQTNTELADIESARQEANLPIKEAIDAEKAEEAYSLVDAYLNDTAQLTYDEVINLLESGYLDTVTEKALIEKRGVNLDAEGPPPVEEPKEDEKPKEEEQPLEDEEPLEEEEPREEEQPPVEEETKGEIAVQSTMPPISGKLAPITDTVNNMLNDRAKDPKEGQVATYGYGTFEYHNGRWYSQLSKEGELSYLDKLSATGQGDAKKVFGKTPKEGDTMYYKGNPVIYHDGSWYGYALL